MRYGCETFSVQNDDYYNGIWTLSGRICHSPARLAVFQIDLGDDANDSLLT